MKRALSAATIGVKRRNTSKLSYDQRRQIMANAAVASSLAKSRGWIPGVTRTSANWLRALPNSSETKYNDCEVSGAITANWVFLTQVSISPTSASPVNLANTNSLVAIAQGTTQNSRIGNKMTVYRVRVQGQLSMNATTSAISASYARIVLVLDTQANGTMAAASDVFESTAAGVTNLFAFQNMDNVGRFRVLKDKRFKIEVPSYSASDPDGAVTPVKLSHKLKDCPIMFSSTTGAVSEIRSNNLFLLWASPTAGVNFQGKTRVYWKDI